MRKATWLLVAIICGLVVVVMYYADFPNGFQPAINKSVLGPAVAGGTGLLATVYANPMWKTYFAPTRWAFVWGLASMAVVAFIALRFVKPQVQKIHIPVIRKTIAPAGPSSIRASTPPGATVRPSSESAPLPELPATIVEEAEEEIEKA